MTETDRKKLEFPVEQNDLEEDRYTNAKETALMNFVESLGYKDSKLFNDLILAGRQESDKSQLSWVKDNGPSNCTDIYHTMGSALSDVTQDDRKYVIDKAVGDMMKPATEHIDPTASHQLKEAEEGKQFLTHGLETENLDEFNQGYRKMSRLQRLHSYSIAEAGATYREILKDHNETLEEAPPNYREVLREETQAKEDPVKEEPAITYRQELLNEQTNDIAQTFQEMKEALNHIEEDKKKDVIYQIVDELMTPSNQHVNTASPHEIRNALRSKYAMVNALESGDPNEFIRGYQQMSEIQRNRHRKLSNEAKEHIREMVREQDEAREEYKLQEELANQATDHKKTPLELWKEIEHTQSMEVYTERAEDQLNHLSEQPRGITTFLSNMKDRFSGNTQHRNVYDLSDSERAKAIHDLVETMRDTFPDLVTVISKGDFPDIRGWQSYTLDPHRETTNYKLSQEENKALYNALQETVDSFDYPQDNAKREHLRHTVTELITHTTEEIIQQFKGNPKPGTFSLPDYIDKTHILTTEASRLKNAVADIGWGNERENQSEMWEQIRHDLALKEYKVRDILKNHNSKQKSD